MVRVAVENGRNHQGEGSIWDLFQPKAEPTPRERVVPSASGELGKKNDHNDHCYQPSKSTAFWHLLRAALVPGTLRGEPLPAAATLWPEPELHPC